MRRKVGAVLIEFAFAIPVFLILIYYIHDLPKQKLLQRKMQFIANEMAAILQNISMQKTITSSDCANAVRLAYLSIFPGDTMLSPGNKLFAFGYCPYAAVYFYRNDGGTVRIQWRRKVDGEERMNVWPDNDDGTIMNEQLLRTNMKIKSNESKIAVQCLLAYDCYGRWGDKFMNGTPCRKVSTRSAFNFLLFSPQGVGSSRQGFFPANVVFSPGPGFSLTPPQ